MSVLVELCAGSAALSIHLLGGNRSLTSYMGSKWRWRREIATALRLYDTPERVVLVDPGPWGVVWQALTTHRDAVSVVVEHFISSVPTIHEEHYYDLLYKMVAEEGTPSDPVAFAGRFLVLQTLNYGAKPVGVRDGAWVVHGPDPTRCMGVQGTARFGAVLPQLPQLPARLRALRNLDRIEVHHCSAMDVPVISGATVYIDPPFMGTTGYGPDDLSRDQVLFLADRWMDRGCRVGVSEGEALPKWPAQRLGAPRPSQGLQRPSVRPTKSPREEWLSVSDPPPQLELAL